MHFDEKTLEWHFETWKWLLENFDGPRQTRRRLILPTPEFFPMRSGRDHESVERLFEHIKELMGMKDWPCRLHRVADDQPLRDEQMQALFGESSSNAPAGWFSLENGEIVIAYHERQTDNPVNLTATLVHELCHYLLRTQARSHPPQGWGDHELHTDVMCGFMGFGVFMCNAALEFKQASEGLGHFWSWSKQGYLSESEHAYVLALFCLLNGVQPEQAARFLDPNPLNYFGIAVEDLEQRHGEIVELVRVEMLDASLPPILSVESEQDGEPPDEKEDLEGIRLTFQDIEALEKARPWHQPLWTFYERLVGAQPGKTWHEMERAALASLQPNLRAAALAMRFSRRFDHEGLQGAVILEDDADAAACERMLGMTADAFESLEDPARADFLRDLLPLVKTHFEGLERAEREGALEEFFSPLDQDEIWRGLSLRWLDGLRAWVLHKPRTLTHPV